MPVVTLPQTSPQLHSITTAHRPVSTTRLSCQRTEMCFVCEFSLSTLWASTSVHRANKTKPAFIWLKLEQSYYIKLNSFYCFLCFSDPPGLPGPPGLQFTSTQPSCFWCINSACLNNPCLVHFSIQLVIFLYQPSFHASHDFGFFPLNF